MKAQEVIKNLHEGKTLVDKNTGLKMENRKYSHYDSLIVYNYSISIEFWNAGVESDYQLHVDDSKGVHIGIIETFDWEVVEE